MRHRLLLFLCMLPFLGVGCGFSQNMRKNIVYSPLYAATECIDHHRHMLMGREAWLQMAGHYSEYQFSCDYRRGFVEGFADYLDFGGTGEPPPIPPPNYRLPNYETPAGLAMMEDWTVGFRHGAATAKLSGLRDLATIPVYLGPVYPTSLPIVNPPKSPEKLPPPKKLDDAEVIPPPPSETDDEPK